MLTWQQVLDALQAATPEQLARTAKVWVWNGLEDEEGFYDNGTALQVLHTCAAEDIHSSGHTYAHDELVLVATENERQVS